MSDTKIAYYDELYTQLVAEFPDKPWITHISQLVEKKANSINVLGDKSISYGLSLFDSNDRYTTDQYFKNIISESIFYGSNFLDILNGVKGLSNRNRLRTKFEAAFSRADAMRAIQFEIFSLIFIQGSGNKVEYMDYSLSNDTYDYLVTDNYNVKTQVECKSFAYDRGLYITTNQANSIREKILIGLEPKIACLLNEPLNMLCSITIHVKQKIGKDEKSLCELVGKLLFAIENGKGVKNNIFDIVIEKFSNLKNISDEFIFQDVPLKSKGIELATHISMPQENNSRVHVRITSELTEGYLKKFEKTCKDAAKKQLKKDRPASIFIHFTNYFILKESLNQKKFKRVITKIFEKDHLTSIVFAANTHIEEKDEWPFFTIFPIFFVAKNANSKFKNSINFLDHLPNQKPVELTL
ncbi:hypothetical protein EH138_14490 [Salmonella enterica subsp. enterica serovar Eastbourne]|uniref:Uncharacterized protein n=1 Tax=Salmonella enterica subsp. enterica serovar Eastbourne TaxID=486993 RepID=A0A702B514_SALET|nr:hypothetical protein [Salmonella enterica subsp. enterica serovar Eastbourne]ECA1896468.1 hypothetical protein [Salmonella enterica subsp. enterica serovar Eastbourne]HAC6676361.1 hypothetical protein [Salmonella enterica subsp. enterica serovar Eastbourne]HAE5114735.1 hypothetical protein [Salmonella enterica subsp. enterica serovar Eastbourne]HAE8029055.1 hypothetical protein [Salmonella enterica subsp. enterica serovar Eastbourne]